MAAWNARTYNQVTWNWPGALYLIFPPAGVPACVYAAWPDCQVAIEWPGVAVAASWPVLGFVAEWPGVTIKATFPKGPNLTADFEC